MMKSKTLSKLALPLLFLFLIVGVVQALTLTSITPAWSNITGTSGAPDCLTTPTVGAEVQIRFGDDDFSAPCPGSPNVQSGLGFEGGAGATFNSGQPFVLGELTHYNNPVFASSLLQSASLDLTVSFSDPVYNGVFSTTVTLDETANNLNTCPYGDTQPCADRISVERQSFLFSVGPTNYQFEILGFIPGTLGSCSYSQSQISPHFISDENAANSACLFGTLTTIGAAELIITKESNVSQAQAGDFIDYRIDYNCFSTTTFCAGVVLTDFLPDEVVYVGSTGSTHTIQPTGVYSENNHTVRFDFVNPLPAGSTGFVRVRVQVRNDGTVPNGELIQNTAISTLTNGATSTALDTIPAVAFSNWEVVKTSPGSVYLSTDPPVTDATYTVGICPAGSTVNLLNAVMIDTLPDNAVFISASGSPAYNAGPPQTLTWNMGDLSANGGCANRTVTLRFPEPPFTNGNLVTNTVSASGNPVGEPAWTDTDDVTDPLVRLIPDPRATLSKAADRQSYVVGAIAQFRLSPANTGNVPLQNFTVTDTLPPQLTVTRISVGSYSNFSGQVNIRYQSSDNPGVWVNWPGGPFTPSNQILNVSSLGLPGGAYITHLQWQYGTVQPGFSTSAGARIYAQIIDPDHNGSPVVNGDTITNNAVLTWDYPPGNGGSGISGSEPGSAGITVTVMPSPLFSKSSAGGISSTWRFLIGQQVGYYVLNVNNNSGVALDDFTITDSIPPQFEVTSITVGSDSIYTGLVTIRYQTSSSPGVWVNWPGGPFPDNNQTLNVSSLGLPAGTYLTAVQWDFGTIPIDFNPTSPRIMGRVINPDRNGSLVSDGSSMTNNATVAWTYQGEPDDLDDSVTNTVREPIAEPGVQKSVLTTGPYIPSAIVRYRLQVSAQGNSPSVLINPIVMELLPADLLYVPGTWSFNPGGTGAPNPNFEELPNYNGTGRTLLRWSFTGSAAHNFPQGQSAYITFDAAISPGTIIGNLVNDYYITSNDVPIVGNTTDINDLDGDGQITDTLDGASTSVIVDELVGLDSVKGVRGQLDTGFSVYPQTGRTIPNGEVTYRLSVINEGNIPIQNVRVVDILPFVGDTGVQDLSQRNTQWRPVLTGLVASPPGVTVYYSTSGNPCRPEIVSSGPPGCTAPNWSTLPPADISTVRSLRFDFAGILNPGQTFNFTWTMQAPPDAPEGEIAWNSFAFTSTNAQTGYPLRPAEPNKVGIEIEIPVIAPLIHLEKATNGEDADLPTGPLVPVGGTVTWTYVITNTGNTRLANITLTDDVIAPLVCAEGAIPNLDPGEDFTCTVTGTALNMQYANIGTVVGTPVDADDNPLIDPDTGDPVPPVSDDDPSHYRGYDPTLARLGDRVWIDANNNGIQDAGEVGLPGVTVRLLNSGGTVLQTTTTGGDGGYYFVNLAPGSYAVEFVLPGVYSFSAQDQGSDDALDSDADPATGRTIVTTLTAGEDDPTWDAGVIALASIGDYVWRDGNNNGIQDASEPPMPGVTVRLLNSVGSVIATTITDADGIYRFLDLLPGDYAIEVVAPAGYTFSPQNQGGDSTRDSDVDTFTGRSANTTLESGENDPTWDAGLVPLASIGDRVWRDNNNNGLQDSGEPGVSGVTVRLYDGSGTLVSTTTTNASGSYLFSDLRPGDYYVVVTLPAGYMFSAQDVGANNAIDSDVDTTTGQTITTTLDPGENDLTWDAGLVPLASIGDRVWLDINNNGIQDGGESGFPGVTVNLLDSGGSVLQTTTTNASGSYLFANLPPGVYAIEVIRPADHVFSPQNVGDDAADSDVNRTTGRTPNTTLSPGENDLTWDAGLVPDASIGNYVWYDTNNNGIQDMGEPPAENVTVRLLDSGGTVIDTTTTDVNGLYLFDNLTPAVYALEFVPPAGYVPARRDQGADDTVDSDPNRFTGRTINTTLDPDEDDMTWDMGLVLAASIGDFVWRDNNGNSVQDAGEPGVASVTVRLLDSANTVIATTTTDSSGFYSFTNLPPDDYRIEVVLPSGFVFSLPDTGSDDEADSDVNITTGRSPLTTLDPGENDMSWDAGLIPVASIGNFVWRDNNNNGLQDGGEPGVSGVTVRLLNSSGTILQTTTTNASGIYSFTNLRPGDYAIEFVLPANFIFSPQDQGADDALDSDADTTTGRTIVTTLDPDENDMTWDAGLTPLGSIGNRVWRDNNMNGIQNGGETNVSGVTVRLLDSGGAVLQTTTTNASGNYLFSSLEAGSYIVEFVLPANHMFTLRDQGANDAVDSDPDTTTGRTAVISLAWGQNDDTWDAGIFELASIGDRVWYDTNDNGLQDGGESGVAGVTVTLYNSSGTAIATTTTNASGSYSFTGLVPGDYSVGFTLPAGHVFSRRDQGANDAIDSDPDRTTGRTVNTTLSPGENDMTWDAGIMRVASIGNYVWYDANDNGLQDVGENGVENVIVRLYNSADTLIGTTTTDPDGLYLFENLVPGDYYVIFTLPSGHVFSRRDQGADDALDSDPDRTTGRTATTNLLPDEHDLTWDAGIMQVASIGDRVWNDVNDNGLQDAGELGVAGVTVTLYDSGGTVVSTTTTNASGSYLFDNLVPGDYSVGFTLPAGYVFSRRDQGADDALDSDPDRATGRTVNTTLLPGENDLTWDAGIMQVASLGNFVWDDLNANGIQDAGEPGIPNVTVTLYDSTDTALGTSTTTVAGLYLFQNLVPGDYYVTFTPPTGYVFSPQDAGSDDALDSDPDTTTGRAAATTLLPGENDLTWDAGLYQYASLGNFVWSDTNANGVQDAGEPGIENVTVSLYDSSDNLLGTISTNSSGFYLFQNLVPGDYYVVFTPPTGYVFSPQDAGSDDTLDSDPDTTTGRTATTTLISGENDLTWDAGLYQYASLGNFVWDDLNADGVQDAGEPGIPNVTVTLYNGAGTQVGSPTTTNASGFYVFQNLVPGDYYVVFTLPTGYVFSPQDAGSDDALDSDADTTTGRAATTTLISGENDLTWDAGMYQFASLGNFVWDDLNADGIQDAGEPGIPNVTVTLYNGAGTQVGSPTTTDASGFYLFQNLVPGDYYVIFTLPTGYVFSPQDAGSDDALDSDPDTTTGRTATTTLISGENDLTWDAGMYQFASLGNFVWDDLNADGIQDAGEPGIPNVTVTLYNGAGTQVGSPTTTNASGFYLFQNLVPGDYYVTFTPPTGYVFSPQDAGSDDALDSDPDTTTGRAATTTLISGENDLTWDAGMYLLASLGNFVWDDLNADGIQDAGEPGIPNVTVTLYNGAGTQVGSPTTTNASGFYLFQNLVPGDYYVTFTPPTGYVFSPQDAGSDDALDSDADTTTGQAITTTLISGENDLTWDAGLYQFASLGNFVWDDLNADGVQDAGEPGIPNVTVTLYNGAGTQVGSPTTTNASGFYLFQNLVPGDYYVVFTPPTGYVFSPQDAGSDDALDSDADTTTGRAATTTLISGENDLTWDAGMYLLASLGNFVWDDLNADGLQDAGEPGIPNVTVTLYNGAGTQVGSPTTTDASGFYVFQNLVPGDYYIIFTLPVDYVFSPQDAGSDDTLDSDADTTTGQAITTTLISGENDLTWDAGMYLLASLGNFVWDDLNADGIQDAGEPGIPNVVVSLYDGADNFLALDVTDADGFYLFENLIPGDYYVIFALPVDYVFSPQDAGSDDALDSDADTTTGQAITTTLISGENDLTWDAGMYQFASLGDYMWYDSNGNGLQDITELPVVGMTVRLYDGAGDLINTTLTDFNGLYLFDTLVPGDYYVIFTPPADYMFTQQDRGLDDTIDSDADSVGRAIVTTLISGEYDPTWDAGVVPIPPAVLAPTPTPTPSPTPAPPVGGQPLTTCQAVCVDWMLYHTNQTGDWEIFRLGDLEGSISANLSQGIGSNDIAPSRSPNAEWVVFASDRDGNWEIYLAPSNGDSSRIQRLTHNTVAIDTDPVWGPGNYIVFESTRSGSWDLYLMDMTSGAVRQITDSPANDINAFWSPDGSKLVFQSDRSGMWQIYELDLATLRVRLLSDGQGLDLDPQYSNDGTRIGFRSYRDGSDSVLYIMHADGSGVQRISDLAGDATDHSWSPDDSLIAYQSDLDGDLDIYVYEVATGQTRKLTDNDIPDYAPTWRCSTNRVVFTSDIMGNPDIFDAEALPISAPPIPVDEEAIQLTFDPADDIYPEGAPLEENASREGQLPNITPGLGQQTIFLQPDASLTEIDLSLETSVTDWSPIDGCAALPPEE
jgi:uncharacterized repeat protein (TIGR01451 family)